jgi:hypothetical protein
MDPLQGYYDQSIPPALLVSGARRAAGGQTVEQPAVDQQQPSPVLLVTAGAPGQYVPAVKAVDRPRNVTELNSSGAQPDPVAPWTAGQYVSVGTSGKRAHWAGDEWRGGESPGYPDAPVQNEQPVTGLAAAPRHAAPEPAKQEAPAVPPAPYRAQFPGDEQDGDLTR